MHCPVATSQLSVVSVQPQSGVGGREREGGREGGRERERERERERSERDTHRDREM